jgi:hypothetical protein
VLRGIRFEASPPRSRARRCRSCDRHPLHEFAHAPPPALGETVREGTIVRQTGDHRAQRLRILAFGEETGFPVDDDFGNAARHRRRDRPAEGHRVEEHGTHALFARAETGDRGRGKQGIRVVAEAGQVNDINQAEPLDFASDLGPKRAVTHEQRLQLGAPAICVRHRADEVHRILMPDQLRHLDDEGTVRRYAASGERRGRRRLDGSTQVDAVRHDGDPGARDSAGT